MTTEIFHQYLESLGLFRWTIYQTPSGIEATLSQDSEPPYERLTNVYQNPDDSWQVRLSKKDYFNEAITQDFFNKK